MSGFFYGNNRVLIITALIVLTMLLLVYIIGPSIIGYITYQKIKSSNYSIEDYGKNMQELRAQLSVAYTNSSACSEFNNKLLTELEKYLDKSFEYKDVLNDLKINLSLTRSECELNIKSLKAELNDKDREVKNALEENNKEINKLKEEKDAEINNLKSQYDLLAHNTANNLCCKAKVDNPKIQYYRIEDDKIMCMEEGALPISC